MPLPPDEHIRLAHAHVCDAIRAVEATAADAYAEAAYNARLTYFGNHCAKRALLQRIRADLNLLQRSVSAPGLLAAEE
jgi:hypothetical protein